MFASQISAPQRRRRDAAILAAIGVSHLFVFALLWRAAPFPRPRATTPALELVRVDAMPVTTRGTRNQPGSVGAASGHRTTAPEVRDVAPAPVRVPVPVPAPVPPAPTRTPAAPIDWFAERDRAASDAATASTAPAPRGFGFPQAPSAGTAAPKSGFGWSHSHTHRIEPLAGGGLLINLTDQCALVLFPLPLVGCALGKQPANGALFGQMHGKAQDGDWQDAPLQVP